MNAAGQLLSAWLENATPRDYRPCAPKGTPPKLHKITDRAARKAKARAIGLQRYRHIEAGGTFKTFAYAEAA